MEFNTCPICKSRLKMRWLGLKATCEQCNINLIESGVTTGLQVAVTFIGLIVMTAIQRHGTDRILATDPEDPFWALFPYYLSLVFYMVVIVGIVNYIIRNYFAVYEPPKNK